MSDISIGKVVVSPNKVNVKGTFKISVYIKEYRQDITTLPFSLPKKLGKGTY